MNIKAEKMSSKSKKTACRALLILSIVNVLLYASVHMTYLYTGTESYEIFGYISIYLNKIADFLLPIAVTSITFTVFCIEGIKSAIFTALITSASRCFFAIPYYYMLYIYNPNYNYDSIESIALAIPSAIAEVIFSAFIAAVFIAVWALAAAKKAKCTLTELRAVTLSSIHLCSYTSFLEGANFALLSFSFMRFIYAIAVEIFDTVSFFIEVGTSYRANEILTIIIGYLLSFVLLAIGYITAVFIKGATAKGMKSEE